MKNIVKLMISVCDAVVPVGLIIVVSLLWLVITPYTIILVVLLLVCGGWLLRKGAIFSAKRYKLVKSQGKLDIYLNSEEHAGFYKSLMLPNYIAMAVVIVISISTALSLIVAKMYVTSHGNMGHVALLTGVAFLQLRSFSGIIMRAGAYNRSISAIYGVVTNKKYAP